MTRGTASILGAITRERHSRTMSSAGAARSAYQRRGRRAAWRRGPGASSPAPVPASTQLLLTIESGFDAERRKHPRRGHSRAAQPNDVFWGCCSQRLASARAPSSVEACPGAGSPASMLAATQLLLTSQSVTSGLRRSAMSVGRRSGAPRSRRQPRGFRLRAGSGGFPGHGRGTASRASARADRSETFQARPSHVA